MKNEAFFYASIVHPRNHCCPRTLVQSRENPRWLRAGTRVTGQAAHRELVVRSRAALPACARQRLILTVLSRTTAARPACSVQSCPLVDACPDAALPRLACARRRLRARKGRAAAAMVETRAASRDSAAAASRKVCKKSGPYTRGGSHNVATTRRVAS